MSDAPLRLITQVNLWFQGWPEYRNYWLNGRWMVPFEPLLGYTDSSDPEVMLQELQWAARYTGRSGANIIYSLEWIKPEIVGNELLDAVIDPNLRKVFLPAIARTRSRWYLFYDPILAPIQRQLASGPPIDYSRPEILRMFRSDLDYFERHYLDHPQYWKIRGRPVLSLWAVPDGMLNAEEALAEARARGLYLLGDTFGRPGPVPQLDGRTGFVAATPEIVALGREWELRAVFPYFERYYRPTGDGVDTIPALSCQYDDTEFQAALGDASRAIRILARDRGDVEAFLRLAEAAAEPIDAERYIFGGTLENWAEGTSLLPTEIREPKFWDTRGGVRRIGYYQFEHLEAVRTALFPEVRAYDGPRLRLAGRRIRFVDCDRMGKLELRGRGRAELLNPPDWRSGLNLEELSDFRRAWTPRWRRGARPRRLRLIFHNLDGLSTELEVRPERRKEIS